MTEGIVYILTNEAMPGYIKIGKTAEDLDTRIRQLDGTNMPLPFTCFYAAKVADCDFVERQLHEAFADHRVRQRREFFRLSPERAVAALAIANGKNITPNQDIIDLPEDEKALNEARQRRGRFSFDLVGIKAGTVLQSSFDANVTCIVASQNKVLFEGQEMSLSASAQIVSERHGYKWAAIAGPDYWLFEGKSLTEIRYELETAEEPA